MSESDVSSTKSSRQPLVWALALLVAASVLYLVVEQPWQESSGQNLQIVAETYQVELFDPPQQGVELGSTFREDDQLILTTGCYRGEPKERRLVDLEQATLEFSRAGTLTALLSPVFEGQFELSRAGKVELTFEGFWEETLVNVEPTFADHCLQRGELRDEPVIGALLRVDHLKARVFDENDRKIDLKTKGLTLPTGDGSDNEAPQGLHGDLEGTLELDGKGDLIWSGTRLYVGFKRLTPGMERESETVVLTPDTDPFETELFKYRLYVSDRRLDQDPPQVDLRITNSRLGRDPWEGEALALEEGGFADLYSHDGQKDYLQVIRLDESQLEIEIHRVSFAVERGVQIVESDETP